jgi:hypothetical protein
VPPLLADAHAGGAAADDPGVSLAPTTTARPWAERAVATFARWPLVARVAVPVAAVVLGACLAATAVEARLPEHHAVPVVTTVTPATVSSTPVVAQP